MERTFNININEEGELVTNLPEELAIIEDFLVADVNKNNIKKYLKILNNSINYGSETNTQITGNTTTLEIIGGHTKISNNYLEESCEISTIELSSIIKSYLEQLVISVLSNRVNNIKEEQEKEKLKNLIQEIKVKEFTGDLGELFKKAQDDKRA